MKVLCPIDFSKASVSACKWVAQFLKDVPNSELHLLHCVNIRSRATIFLKLDDVLTERAKEDIEQLKDELYAINSSMLCESTIVVFDPKTYIPSFAKNHHFDIIVTGTKGLTALKNMTVGSVTEAVINKAEIPVLTIPEGRTFRPVKKVVIGVDDNPIGDEAVLKPLIDICKLSDAKLMMVHVKGKDDNYLEYDPSFDLYFKGLDYEYKSLDKDENVVKTLTDYSDDENAEILCMIHRKKNWFKRLLYKSMTKEELFEIETPLLILPGRST